MFKNTRVTVGIMMVVVVGLLVACGSNQNADENSNVIRIGSMFELTGSAAEYGISMNEAVHMAADEINAAGGVDGKEIEIVERDIASDEVQAAQATMALATEENVLAIIGPALTGTLQASIPSANDYQIPIISPSATDDGVLQDDDGNVHPYAYRTSFTNSFQGGALASFANTNLNATKAIIFADNSSDYELGLTETFRAAFDGEIVAIENFTTDQTDFSATLTNIRNLDFDVLYVP